MHAGKSLLLKAILGELIRQAGSAHCAGHIAYVPQDPWIMSGTVRCAALTGRQAGSMTIDAHTLLKMGVGMRLCVVSF